MSTLRSGALTLEFAGEQRTLSPPQTLTFGRRADLAIDESNRQLHRVLGEFVHTDGRWTLRNVGRTISLLVTDLAGASFAKIAPGSEVAVPFQNASVTFSAGRANYRIDINQQLTENSDDHATFALPAGYADAEHTMTATTLAFNDEQFQLLMALAARRLDGPVTVADLPSNRQLANELGWTPSKLVRKLDHLCVKLDRAGIVGLVGTSAASATDRKVRLADIAVEHGLVTRDDLGSSAG